MLRSLVRTEPECYPAWPSIEEGLEAKRELERCQKYYEDQLLPMALGTSESKVGDTYSVGTWTIDWEPHVPLWHLGGFNDNEHHLREETSPIAACKLAGFDAPLTCRVVRIRITLL